jgi:hypothetical protein
MDQYVKAVELRIWREAGTDGRWRCRVIAPDALHTVRLDDYQALSAYVASQINIFIESQMDEEQSCEEATRR